MKLSFQSAERAASPVIYLCCADATRKTTGTYNAHIMQIKEPSPVACDVDMDANCGKRANDP